jgi:hypothetical protein
MKRLKNPLLLLLPVIGFAFVLMTSFGKYGNESSTVSVPQEKFVIPEGINTILDNKCFGCHNTESTNDKAKDKLLIDKLPELSKAKLVAKLDGIAEIVGKNEMPPEKFLAKYPDKALSSDESKQLTDWAKTASEELMK